METETPKRSLINSETVEEALASKKGYPTRRFKATEMWNDLQNTFVDQCPRKRHRRNFVNVEDSFTGREAVDFLMEMIPRKVLNGRTVSRENCSTLLQKFLNEKVFFRHGCKDAKEQVFRDNNTLFYFPAWPKIVPRLIAEGSSTLRRTSSATNIQRKQSLSPIRAASPWKVHELPTSPDEPKIMNKRLSMSTGNLLSFDPRLSPDICSFREISKDTTPTCDRTRTFYAPREDSDEGIYEFLKFSRWKKKGTANELQPPIPPSLPCDLPRNVVPPVTKPPAPVKVASRMLNEVDLWSVWKNCLLDRLKLYMGTGDLSFLSWPINGYELKWNCEKIGSSGVVKSRNDSDDFSAFIMRLMKYLEQFPFHTSSVNVVKYQENQEINVFKTVCSNLRRDSAILTAEETTALLHIVSVFHERSRTISGAHNQVIRNNGQQKSSFFNSSIKDQSISPMSLSTSLSSYSDLPPAIQLNGLHDQIAFSSNSGDRTRLLLSPLTNGRERRSMSERSVGGRLSYDEALQLPGLKHSPTLLKRISEICVSPQSNIASPPSSGLSYKTAYSCPSPVVSKLPTTDADALLSAVSLVLLTLPSSRRRRVHHLVRFMNKLCSNHCLQLDKNRDNRSVVLENLVHTVVPEDGGLTPLQALHLVILLMDNERKIFTVDEQLRKDVNDVVSQIQNEMVVPTHVVANNTPPTNVVQFCEPVDKEIYLEQNDHKEDYLLPLLDQCINDENMKPSVREKKLKQFKTAHPEVFAKRFPDGDIHDSARKPKNRFLRKVFFKK